MNRLGKSLVLMLVILAITQLNSASAQPSTVDTGISINSPNYSPYQNEQYENTTATLNIKVIIVYGQYNQSWIDTIHLDSVCYSLDGQPLVYINEFAVEDYTNYGINQQDFLVYTASIKLENLPEGRHTVTAYAYDTHNEYAYINTLSTAYSFFVNQSYRTPFIEIRSPSDGMILPSSDWQIVFTVNRAVDWMGYSLDGKDSITVGDNFTLSGMPDGSHSLTISANETNGLKHNEKVEFTIRKLTDEAVKTPSPVIAFPVAITIICLSIGFLLFRRHRKNASIITE